MKITYVEHSGFVAETDSAYLVFDYYKGELPRFSEDKKLIFFVSHFHEDHYSKSIYTIAEKHPKVSYVLDRKIKNYPETAEVLSVSPHEEYEFCGAKIKTLHSTDTGVAYLVKIDGKTIYHAGDLHLWVWEGAPKFQRNHVEAMFRRELDRIKNEKIDIAFLPLDPRQEDEGVLGFDYAMNNLNIKKACPMHFWGVEEYVTAFIESEISAPYREKIIPLTKNGESADA